MSDYCIPGLSPLLRTFSSPDDHNLYNSAQNNKCLENNLNLEESSNDRFKRGFQENEINFQYNKKNDILNSISNPFIFNNGKNENSIDNYSHYAHDLNNSDFKNCNQFENFQGNNERIIYSFNKNLEEEMPQDLKAFYNHPLVASNETEDGNAKALLHEYRIIYSDENDCLSISSPEIKKLNYIHTRGDLNSTLYNNSNDQYKNAISPSSLPSIDILSKISNNSNNSINSINSNSYVQNKNLTTEDLKWNKNLDRTDNSSYIVKTSYKQDCIENEEDFEINSELVKDLSTISKSDFLENSKNKLFHTFKKNIQYDQKSNVEIENYAIDMSRTSQSIEYSKNDSQNNNLYLLRGSVFDATNISSQDNNINNTYTIYRNNNDNMNEYIDDSMYIANTHYERKRTDENILQENNNKFNLNCDFDITTKKEALEYILKHDSQFSNFNKDNKFNYMEIKNMNNINIPSINDFNDNKINNEDRTLRFINEVENNSFLIKKKLKTNIFAIQSTNYLEKLNENIKNNRENYQHIEKVKDFHNISITKDDNFQQDAQSLDKSKDLLHYSNNYQTSLNSSEPAIFNSTHIQNTQNLFNQFEAQNHFREVLPVSLNDLPDVPAGFRLIITHLPTNNNQPADLKDVIQMIIDNPKCKRKSSSLNSTENKYVKDNKGEIQHQVINAKINHFLNQHKNSIDSENESKKNENDSFSKFMTKANTGRNPFIFNTSSANLDPITSFSEVSNKLININNNDFTTGTNQNQIKQLHTYHISNLNQLNVLKKKDIKKRSLIKSKTLEISNSLNTSENNITEKIQTHTKEVNSYQTDHNSQSYDNDKNILSISQNNYFISNPISSNLKDGGIVMEFNKNLLNDSINFSNNFNKNITNVSENINDLNNNSILVENYNVIDNQINNDKLETTQPSTEGLIKTNWFSIKPLQKNHLFNGKGIQGNGKLKIQQGSSQNTSNEKIDPDLSGYSFYIKTPFSTTTKSGEDRLTYLNKGQCYTLVFDHKVALGEVQNTNISTNLKTKVILTFRESSTKYDYARAWEFWHSKQPTYKQRVINVDYKSYEQSQKFGNVQEISQNAVDVFWRKNSSVELTISLHCLSTDFTYQKGLKINPLHVQLDTYEGNDSNVVVHRAYCQVKVFCDKGAERKAREEEKKRMKMSIEEKSNKEVTSDRSYFYCMEDSTLPVYLFSPNIILINQYSPNDVVSTSTLDSSAALTDKNLNNSQFEHEKDLCLIKTAEADRMSTNIQKIMIYVKEESDSVFTALSLCQANLKCLIQSIKEKYPKISNSLINILKLSKKGLLVKVDNSVVNAITDESIYNIKFEWTKSICNEKDICNVTLMELNDC